MSAPKRIFKCCVLGCTNERSSLHRLPPSEPEDTVVKFHCLRKCPRKKSVKSPIRVEINTNALCANVSSRQSAGVQTCHVSEKFAIFTLK